MAPHDTCLTPPVPYIPPEVLVTAWLGGPGAGTLTPQDIGALLRTSRAWRSALYPAEGAPRDQGACYAPAPTLRLLQAHLECRLPGLDELVVREPPCEGLDLAHILARSGLRIGALLDSIDDLLRAADRTRNEPYRAKLASFIDRSLWAPATAGIPGRDRGDRCVHTLWALGCVLAYTITEHRRRMAERAQSTGSSISGRPNSKAARTDLRPWALFALYSFVEDVLSCGATGCAGYVWPMDPDLALTMYHKAAEALTMSWRDANRRLHTSLRALLGRSQVLLLEAWHAGWIARHAPGFTAAQIQAMQIPVPIPIPVADAVVAEA